MNGLSPQPLFGTNDDSPIRYLSDRLRAAAWMLVAAYLRRICFRLESALADIAAGKYPELTAYMEQLRQAQADAEREPTAPIQLTAPPSRTSCAPRPAAPARPVVAASGPVTEAEKAEGSTAALPPRPIATMRPASIPRSFTLARVDSTQAIPPPTRLVHDFGGRPKIMLPLATCSHALTVPA